MEFDRRKFFMGSAALATTIGVMGSSAMAAAAQPREDAANDSGLATPHAFFDGVARSGADAAAAPADSGNGFFR